MSTLQRGISVPVWTPLVTDRHSPSVSSVASEYEDMTDELAPTPSPTPDPRKRKNDSHTNATDSARKKSKLNDGDTEQPKNKAGSSTDIPASAYAKLTRPPAFTQPSTTARMRVANPSLSILAKKAAFEHRYGPMPSSSSQPNPASASPPTAEYIPRHVARKSAAASPPGMRRMPRNNPVSRPHSAFAMMPPPATAPPRLKSTSKQHASSSKGKARASSDYSDEFPSVSDLVANQKKAEDRKKSVSAGKQDRRRTIADASEVIELSTSDESPPKSAKSRVRKGIPIPRRKVRIHDDEVIILPDSEDEFVAQPTRSFDSESSEPVQLSKTKKAPSVVPQKSVSPVPAAIHGVSAHGEDDMMVDENPHVGISDAFSFRPMAATVRQQESVAPSQGHQGFDQQSLKEHQTYGVPSPPAELGDANPDALQAISVTKPTLSMPREIPAQQLHDDNVRHKLSSGKGDSTPSSLGVPSSPQELGSTGLEEENLVPALGDMALEGSAGASQAASVRSASSTGAADSFEDWDNADGSYPTRTSSASAMNEDVEQAPAQEEVSSPAPPQTPVTKPPSKRTIQDIDLVAEAAKSKSNRKKPDSRHKNRFNFTPSIVSPASSAPAGGLSSPVPSAHQSPSASPLASRRRPPPVEVVGSLYSGDGGFFKAILSRRASTDTTQALSRHASASAVATPPASEQSSPTAVSTVASTVQTSAVRPSQAQPAAPPSISATVSSEEPSPPPRLSLPAELARFDQPMVSTPQPSPPAPTMQSRDVQKSSEERRKASKAPVPIPRLALGPRKTPASAPTPATPALQKTIATAQIQIAKQMGAYIDLTLSDDDEMLDINAYQEAMRSTKLLANLCPDLMDDAPIESTGDVRSELETNSSPDRPLDASIAVVGAVPQSGPLAAVPLGISTAQAAVQATISPPFQSSRDSPVVATPQDDEENSVVDLLYGAPSRRSPDTEPRPILHTRRISPPRIFRTRPARGSSSASSLAYQPESPVSAPETHTDTEPGGNGIPVESAISSALVAHMSNVHMSNEITDSIMNWRDGLTWQTFGRKLAREYADVYLRAKNLPHSLQDHLNNMSEYSRRVANVGREIFKAMISNNTKRDEPNAPPIDIVNEVDDDECPPFEFYYTNLMWHSPEVKPPNFSKLKGCDCYPFCQPTSKSCACVKRQKQHYDEKMSGFAYDSRGKLRQLVHGYPIYECNALCGCDDDCRNRVVQHGRKVAINIEKTAHKGWGVFAAQRILSGTFIGIYAGEYLTNNEGEKRGLTYNLGNRTYLFDIDFWHIKKDKNDAGPKYCVDAYHAGNFTRYLNHSCDPNCHLVAVYINEPDEDKPLLSVFTTRDVLPGEELCFSYYGPPDDDDDDSEPHEPQFLGDDEIFVPCQCGAAKCKGRMWK